MEASTDGLPTWRPAALVVTAGLGLAAAIALAYNLALGLGPEDTNHLETALVVSAGRQLTEGPGALYGPYGPDRTCPLIHAPLYYRLTALAAWPLAAAGIDAWTACLIAGRALAFASMIALLVLIRALGRSPGAPAISGTWAALLVASSISFLNFPVSVRPDLMAMAFQTAGFLWTVRAAASPDRPWRLAIAASLAFAVAACIKQHDIGVAAVSYIGLLIAWTQGRFRLAPILAGGGLALATTVAYYAAENVVTGGALFDSAFRVAGRFREVVPGGWIQIQAAWGTLARESAPLLALMAVVAVGVPRSLRCGFFDGWVALALFAEVALATFCFAGSTGAWTNYAFQALVFASILVARGLGRSFQGAGVPAGIGLALAAAILAVLAVELGRICHRRIGWRSDDRVAWADLERDERIRPFRRSETYVGLDSGYNRLYGRPELTHDEWAYSVVERLGEAPARSGWLREAIEDGPVRRVVVIGEAEGVPGVPASLNRMGYRQVAHHGRFYVWDRR